MCGIAGLIHRGKSSNVGSELQGMLQALKHRGEDSTGYALYGDTDGKNFIMRFKVGENVGEGSSSIMEDVSVYDQRKKIVDQYLSELGAKIVKEERILPYSLRYELAYDVKDLLDFSQKIEILYPKFSAESFSRNIFCSLKLVSCSSSSSISFSSHNIINLSFFFIR